MRRGAAAVASLLLLCLALPAAAQEQREPEQDLTALDLSGDWYVFLQYKDDDSEDKSILKFKDFAWSIEQRPETITWENYPYVVFDEETELVRRHAMTSHVPWEPDAGVVDGIRSALQVSSRAMSRKRLTGSVAQGFKSLAPLATGGLNTLGFASNWDVSFGKERVKIIVTDALSGSSTLAGMEEATVYEIRERVGQSELRGSYEAETRHGTLRMLRTQERQVVK
jgi:hypothetical protein